jgi:benzoate/toluate 1,2-dioxygenase subunit beta
MPRRARHCQARGDQSGLSPASSPVIRTCHLITNVRITTTVNAHPQVSSHWQVQIYRPEKHHAFTYFGFYEHVLRPEGDHFRIAKKKIILLNDVVESVLDVYHV